MEIDLVLGLGWVKGLGTNLVLDLGMDWGTDLVLVLDTGIYTFWDTNFDETKALARISMVEIRELKIFTPPPVENPHHWR